MSDTIRTSFSADSWSPVTVVREQDGTFGCRDGRVYPLEDLGAYLLSSTAGVPTSPEELPLGVRDLDLDELQRSWPAI